MRHPDLALLSVLAIGCTADRLALEHRSTLLAETRGVALHEDGRVGHAAMWDTTCEFDVRTGTLLGDVDLPTDAERVDDAYGGVALAVSGLGVHHVRDLTWQAGSDVPMTGVGAARLFDQGVAILGGTDTCRASWHRGGDIVTVDVPEAVCRAGTSVTIDRVSGVVFAATGTDVFSITGRGATGFGVTADLAAWDATSGALYTAVTGGSVIVAVDADGRHLWTTDVRGRVHAMEQLGEHGAVAVVVATDRGAALRLFDGRDGAARGSHGLPDLAGITTSANGDTVGLVLPDQVFFYDVALGGSVRYESGMDRSDRPRPQFSTFTD